MPHEQRRGLSVGRQSVSEPLHLLGPSGHATGRLRIIVVGKTPVGLLPVGPVEDDEPHRALLERVVGGAGWEHAPAQLQGIRPRGGQVGVVVADAAVDRHPAVGTDATQGLELRSRRAVGHVAGDDGEAGALGPQLAQRGR